MVFTSASNNKSIRHCEERRNGKNPLISVKWRSTPIAEISPIHKTGLHRRNYFVERLKRKSEQIGQPSLGGDLSARLRM